VPSDANGILGRESVCDETLRSIGLRATQLAVLVAVDNGDVMSIEGGLTATAHKRRALLARRSCLPIGLVFRPFRPEEAANTCPFPKLPSCLTAIFGISIHGKRNSHWPSISARTFRNNIVNRNRSAQKCDADHIRPRHPLLYLG